MLYVYLDSCRYYVAEGVRIYSQETWKQVTADKGKQLVETYIASVVGILCLFMQFFGHS